MNRRQFIASSTGAAAVLVPYGTVLGATPKPPEKDSAAFPYAPGPKPKPVAKPGEFIFAAAHLDHGHIYGQCASLIEAGATLKWVYEPDDKKLQGFIKRYPQAKPARTLNEILDDPAVKLVAAAAVTSERGPLGCKVMEGGKDYFTDKAPFTTLEQLAKARSAAERTKRKYMVYYSERLSSESGMFATDLVQAGVIGKVVHMLGLGPHRLNKRDRPAWFFEREKFGGILCDIGSHQCEQFLTYTGATDAKVAHAAIGNFANPETPEFEDFGEATFVGNNAATSQIRVDWYTPDGLGTWGDGRTLILGTKGYIELRKYIDVGRDKSTDHVFIVDQKGEHYASMRGKVGLRFFGDLILDCLNRTEKAMTQAHAFKAAELCLRAQTEAQRLKPA